MNLAAFPCALAAHFCAAAQGNLVFDPPTVDLGRVRPDEAVHKTVTVKNVGDAAATIVDVHSSCSCTTASIGAPSIAPGASARLTVDVDLSTIPGDSIRSHVFLRQGDNLQSFEVAVTGEIAPEFHAEPAALAFGAVTLGESPTRDLVIARLPGIEGAIARVETTPGITLYPTATEAEGKWRYRVTLAAPEAAGAIRETIVVHTGVPRTPRFEIPVTADAVGLRYTLSRRILAFGAAAPGDFLGSLTLTGAPTMRCDRATPSSASLSAAVRPGESAGEFVIDVASTANTPRGPLNEILTIHLVDGALAEGLEVRVFGMARQGEAP